MLRFKILFTKHKTAETVCNYGGLIPGCVLGRHTEPQTAPDVRAVSV